jgi:uncharacterized protein
MNFETIFSILGEINQDRTVPRNIRTAIENVKTILSDEKIDLPVRINNAVSVLDEVSNDPNIPTYTRTQIWNLVSMLEVINEQAKAAEV